MKPRSVHEETEAVLLETCAHAVVVGNDDGTVSRLVPMKEGQSVPPGATGIALVRRGKEPGKMRVTYVPIRSGPPRVATKKYRSGWDTTFKKLDATLN